MLFEKNMLLKMFVKKEIGIVKSLNIGLNHVKKNDLIVDIET